MQVTDEMVRVADKVSPDRIHARLIYDAVTGVVYWLKRPDTEFPRKCSATRWNRMYAGQPAGGLNSEGYLSLRIDGFCLKVHRIAWCLYHGNWPKETIDHVNGDRSDNRIQNLRDASKIENGKNRGIAKNNRSGHSGVYWSPKSGKWVAFVRQNKRSVRLGTFLDKDAAISARKRAERRYGFHPNSGSRPSFPPAPSQLSKRDDAERDSPQEA